MKINLRRQNSEQDGFKIFTKSAYLKKEWCQEWQIPKSTLVIRSGSKRQDRQNQNSQMNLFLPSFESIIRSGSPVEFMTSLIHMLNAYA